MTRPGRIVAGLLIITSVGVVASAIGGRRDNAGTAALSEAPTSAAQAAPSATPTAQNMTIVDRVDWPNLARLVAAVDVVAVVRWHGDTEEAVGYSAADGTEKASYIDVSRSFEVVRVLKGGEIPDAIEARASRQYGDPPLRTLQASADYLVFLKRLRRDQGEGFGFWGEPGVARIGGESLEWVVTDAYREDKARAGWTLGRHGAVTAFDNLNVADVEQAIAAPPSRGNYPTEARP